VTRPKRSRREELRRRATAATARADRLPGAFLTRELLQRERSLGGVLLEAGVAFRLFLWLVPFGLVVAALLSLWSDVDPGTLEREARRFGLSAVAAHEAARAVHESDRGVPYLLAFGLVMLAWLTLGALRALVLAYALAWGEAPPRIRRPVQAVAAFNGIFVFCVASSSAIASLRTRSGGMLVLGTVMSLVAMVGVALVGMWLLPHPEVRVRDLLPGAVLIAVGYQLVALAVLVWFAPQLGRSEATYGAFGAAATLLVWLYALARLVIGAAFLNTALYTRHRSGSARAPASPVERPVGTGRT
jgi:membrane protein